MQTYGSFLKNAKRAQAKKMIELYEKSQGHAHIVKTGEACALYFSANQRFI